MRQVEIYLNVTVGSAFMAYKPDDSMRCAWRGKMDLPDSDQEALAIVWAKMNMDPQTAETPADVAFREPTYLDRSVSMGDVITLDEERSYEVRSMDFAPIEELRSGDEIVGPEGDAEFVKQVRENPDLANEALAAGTSRMLNNLREDAQQRQSHVRD